MIERPSLHALAVFLAVVDHGTMTAAAEAEHLAQPAISVHVHNLERFYGLPLMDRSGRRLRLTPAGEVVADYARRLLGLVDELGQAVAEVKDIRAGRLVIGASATVAETWLPALLGAFGRAYPGITLDVRLGNSDRILRDVRDNALGFGIVGRPGDDPQMVTRPVFEDRLVPFVARDHPLAQRAAITLDDLIAGPLVLREPGSASREAVVRCLTASALTPRETVVLGSNEAVKRSVAAGLGIGILSERTLDVDMRAGDVTILLCEGWDCRRQFWLVHRPDRLLTRAEQAFLALL
jgi:DNA-binding transcriptional LysR family regulator